MKSKTWEEVHAEARLNLPDPKMYEKESFSTKVFYDTENYTTVHFKKVYGSQHEYSVEWMCTGSTYKDQK